MAELVADRVAASCREHLRGQPVCPVCLGAVEAREGAHVYHMVCLEEVMRPVREALAAGRK